MEQKPKYYFVVQIKTEWNSIIFFTSMYTYETIDQYVEAYTLGKPNKDTIIAYTKVPEHYKNLTHLPF